MKNALTLKLYPLMIILLISGGWVRCGNVVDAAGVPLEEAALEAAPATVMEAGSEPEQATVDEITHTWEDYPEAPDGVLVPRLRPLSDDGVNLDVGLDWVTTQRVFLCNDSLAQVTLRYGAVWPTLDFE